MEYITLASSALRLSRIGFGCAALGGYDYGAVDDAASVRAIHRAIELGVTLFDVADVYGFGHAEEVLGRALASAGNHEAIVATKVGVRWDGTGRTRRDLSRGWILSAVDASLRRLRLERIPLYQIHWPDPETPLADAIATLTDLQRLGKIGEIGVCNLGLDEIQGVAASIASNQLPYSLAERQREDVIRDGAEIHGIPTFAYSVLANGLFSGKIGPATKFAGTDLRRRNPVFQQDALEAHLRVVDRLRTAGARHGRTPAQVAIRWALQQRGVGVALTGAKHVAQIEENVGGCGWTLSPMECEMLARPTSM